MDAREAKWIVLARIPDLNANEPVGVADGKMGRGLPTSIGRMINQRASFKLLAGTAGLLLIGALVPFFTGNGVPSVDPASTVDSATAWHSEPASVAKPCCRDGGTVAAATAQRFDSTAPSANAAPAEKAAAPKAVTNRPATLIAATPERSPAPAMVPPLPEAKREHQPSHSTETPLMSNWPNPLMR